MSDWTSLIGDVNRQMLSAFGREVQFLPQSGGEITIKAVVESAKQPEDTAPGVYAVIFLVVSDLPSAPLRGDQVRIDSTTYVVWDLVADGQGGMRLALRH